MLDGQQELASRLAIAGLIGLAAGFEREWSGHASGPGARFAGLRTFFLLGVLGGAAGALAAAGQSQLAAALVAGAGALCVGAYVMAVRRSNEQTDGTTETAALTVLGLGALAGFGWIGVSAGAAAIVVLMLREKARLHWIVQRFGEPELRAGLQFAVLAVVVLPLLPTGPFLGALALKPRALWMIVLLFSGLNFAGFVAREVVGASRGLGITGALGGIVSSTAVTLSFSRQSRQQQPLDAALSRGVLAACTVLIPRVLIVSATLRPSVALALLRFLAIPFLVGVVLVAVGWGRDAADVGKVSGETDRTPLRLGAAIQMAIAFQVAILVIAGVQRAWGNVGVFAGAVALGVTDVDALTVSMSRPEASVAVDVAARAIAIGILVNTLLKLLIAASFGRGSYRRRTTASLAGLALGSAAGLLL